MSILSGQAPIESGAEFMAPDVAAHVDDWHFRGINVWANWIHYIRTRGRVAAPTLLLDEVVAHADATMTVRGRWRGVQAGRDVISKSCAARYRLQEGRIVEIWSTRSNYAFLCGAHVEYRWGFIAELLRARRWKTRAPQFDLTGGLRVPQAFLPTPAMTGGILALAE